MVEVKKVARGNRVQVEKTYIPEAIVASDAVKKNEIVDYISEGSQLTLLAVIVGQLAEKAELDTPEYDYAKVVFANIRNILAK